MNSDQIYQLLLRCGLFEQREGRIIGRFENADIEGVLRSISDELAELNAPQPDPNPRYGIVIDQLPAQDEWWKSRGPILMESEADSLDEGGLIRRINKLRKTNSWAGRRMEIVQLVGCGTPEEFEARS